MTKKELVLKLHDLGVLKFGNFILKSGLTSPFYLDFRRIVGFPKTLKEISNHLWDLVAEEQFDHLCGVPYAALSLASAMATANDKKGYLEDRRPAANMDPYEVCAALIETTCS